MAGSLHVSKGVNTSLRTRNFHGTREYVRKERSDGSRAGGAGTSPTYSIFDIIIIPHNRDKM